MAQMITKEVEGGKIRASQDDDIWMAIWQCDDCRRGWTTYMFGDLLDENEVLTIAGDYLASHLSNGHSEDGR